MFSLAQSVFPLWVVSIFCGCIHSKQTEKPVVLRVVTWNVGDNSGMEDGFNNEAMDKLLGIDESAQVADIFAVGVQEQCWQCNQDDMLAIPRKFLQRLGNSGSFEIIGIEATRESNVCEFGCKIGTHGTTALFVIARRGLVTQHFGFHRNDGCSDMWPENDEKGVAYMRLVMSTGQSVCVATSHLESKRPKTRRKCLKSFFSDAQDNLKWSSACDFEFISGDFNARTAASAPAGQSNHLSGKSDLSSLKSTDEMVGSDPYGSDKYGNMLDFINSVQVNVFKESPLTFLPTYKVTESAGSCGGKTPCYKTNRPHSWTDRILHTRGKSLKYDSIDLEFSDHYPVYEEFQLA